MQVKTKIEGYKKVELVVILALMSAVAPLSTDMYLPALTSVKESFNSNEFYAQLSLASFFIAFAFGQLIYGPLSDIFGRKKPLLFGICLFILASFGCVIAPDINTFIILRFFEALGGCAGVVIARAVVNDLFEFREAGAMFALMMIVSSLAPMLSPSLGGILLEFFSWESIFISLFILGFILLVLIIFKLDESAPKTDRSEIFSQKKIIANYKFVLKDKVFLIYVLSAGFAMAAMFAYITASSFVFITHFGLSQQIYALLFGFNALGFIIMSAINAKLVLKKEPKKILAFAFLAMSGFSLVLFLCADFGFLAYEAMLFFTIAMLGFIMPNTTTLAMARFKEHSGTASALLGTIQFILAGLLSFSVGFLNANTPSMLALVIFSCVFFASALYFAFIKNVLKKAQND